MRAATARVDASASRAEDQLRRARADLRLAFTGLWAAQERERELSKSRDRLDELAGILGRREELGEAAGFDRLRAEREVIDVDANRAMAATEGGSAVEKTNPRARWRRKSMPSAVQATKAP